MPELPDVQIFKSYFDATSLKKTIVGVEECDTRLLEGVSEKNLRHELKGNYFSETRRYGKYLFARCAEDCFLVLHFGMTGYLRSFKHREKAPKHLGLLLRFEDGYFLACSSQRRLGKIGITESVEDFVRRKDLGPDALELCRDREAFSRRLQGHRGSVKGLLMNQKVLAGIGNIYSDEILFQTGMHPKKKAADLDDRARRLLAGKACHVLDTAVEKRIGEEGWPRQWLLPRREEDRACPRCSGKIRKIKVSGRGAYFCPGHQK
jgi:formamidopyrimidine-DNA glycosylase